MTLHIVLSAKAESEFTESIAWYESQTEGVGRRFGREVWATLIDAAKDHRRYPFAGATTQRIKMLDWPYSIYFVARESAGTMFVVSVFHGARNPSALRRRLK